MNDFLQWVDHQSTDIVEVLVLPRAELWVSGGSNHIGAGKEYTLEHAIDCPDRHHLDSPWVL